MLAKDKEARREEKVPLINTFNRYCVNLKLFHFDCGNDPGDCTNALCGIIMLLNEVHTYSIANWTLQLIGKKFSDAQGANCKIKCKQ